VVWFEARVRLDHVRHDAQLSSRAAGLGLATLVIAGFTGIVRKT
jgi:hypothetical protein